MVGIPSPQMGGRLIFSTEFFSTTSSAITDPNWSILESNASFTENFVATGLQMQITSALSAGAYADHIELKPRRQLSNEPNDVELLCRFTSIAGAGVEQFLELGVRDDGSATGAVRSQNAYFIQVSYNTNVINLDRSQGGVTTVIANVANTWTAASWFLRFVAIGPRFLAKAWATAGPEPRDWQLDFTDTSPNLGNSGFFTLAFFGGNAGNVTWTQDVQEFHIWEIQTPPTHLRRRV